MGRVDNILVVWYNGALSDWFTNLSTVSFSHLLMLLGLMQLEYNSFDSSNSNTDPFEPIRLKQLDSVRINHFVSIKSVRFD